MPSAYRYPALCDLRSELLHEELAEDASSASAACASRSQFAHATMSDFLRGSLSSQSSPSDMDAQKKAVMQQVKSELALASAQELMNKMNEKCFARCITKPGSSLSSSEEKCLGGCMDRYMDAFNIVSRAYMDRLSRERANESRS